MKLRLKEGYGNDHVTTQTGFIFKKDKLTEYNTDDYEVNHLLKQGTLEVVEEIIEIPKEEPKKEEPKIIKEAVIEEKAKVAFANEKNLEIEEPKIITKEINDNKVPNMASPKKWGNVRLL